MSDSSRRLDNLRELREALEGMVRQFGYYGNGAYHTGGLSALEYAFDKLGWSDPHLEPEDACDEPGCGERATCGVPVQDGYRRTCGLHVPWIVGPPRDAA